MKNSSEKDFLNVDARRSIKRWSSSPSVFNQKNGSDKEVDEKLQEKDTSKRFSFWSNESVICKLPFFPVMPSLPRTRTNIKNNKRNSKLTKPSEEIPILFDEDIFADDDLSLARSNELSVTTKSLCFLEKKDKTKSNDFGNLLLNEIDQNMDGIDINVGGIIYHTSIDALSREGNTILKNKHFCDTEGNIFIDRDGESFEYIFAYLQTGEVHLPSNFQEYDSLLNETRHFNLKNMTNLLEQKKKEKAAKKLMPNEINRGSYISLTVHSNFQVKMREQVETTVLNRTASITLAGHVQTCLSLFKQNVNLNHDANYQTDRYSCRMVIVGLKLEKCFDILQVSNYILQNKYNITTSNSGPNEEKWIHATVHVFMKTEHVQAIEEV